MNPTFMQAVHVGPKQESFGQDCGMLRRDSGTRRERHPNSQWNKAITGSPGQGFAATES